MKQQILPMDSSKIELLRRENENLSYLEENILDKFHELKKINSDIEKRDKFKDFLKKDHRIKYFLRKIFENNCFDYIEQFKSFEISFQNKGGHCNSLAISKDMKYLAFPNGKNISISSLFEKSNNY